MDLVYNFLEKTICLTSKDIIVVGVSAGPDSMALLYILNKLREKIGFKIIVAHVNHNVRKESFEEEVFLKNYCDERNILFEKMIIEKYGDDNFHNEARNIRYNFYRSIISKYYANYLMTGHHGDDLVETVLMRIVRGSTLKGYSGFNKIVDMKTYKIVRPLIYATKDEIEKFDIDNNIPYRVDKSNYKDVYTRNRYRKYILPVLKKEDKDVHRKFIKFSETLQEYDNFIDRVTKSVINDVYVDGIIKVNEFVKEDNLIQKRIIDHILATIYADDLIEIDNRHVSIVLKAIYSKKASIKYNLPNDYEVVKEYDKVYFKKVVDQLSTYDIELNEDCILPNGMHLKKIDSCDTDGNDILRLNSNDVLLPLRVRTRKNGDKMIIKNMNQHKKVSDIFIDSKIPLGIRDNYPIVVDSNDKIVWIPKVKKSKYNRRKNETCDIIYKCC